VRDEGEEEQAEGDEEMYESGTVAKESPIKIQDKKRQRKTGEEALTNNTEGSAGPLEGCRREQ
jgi:hypothetical protein